jgi:SAM-dependent methyltransferase
MNTTAVQYFRCISCDSKTLTFVPAGFKRKVAEQESLLCENCSAVYPVIDSIPRFVSSENYTKSFGFQWNVHTKTQLDSYTGRQISEKRLFDVTGWSRDLSGQLILEAGSGAGRFTECLLKTGATVFSFDYSSAVDSNGRNNIQSRRLTLFQADIRNIPLRRATFDKVLCLGVLQHTPGPDKAFMSLSEMVRPGGELVVDLYQKSILGLLQWKYVLRPITTRMDQRKLYGILARLVPALLPAAKNLRRIAGGVGARLIPIAEYSHLQLSPEINEQWAILDTFDMYAPVHDHPQTSRTLKRWFEEAGFMEISVCPGPNGLVGKGLKPR